MPIYGYRCTNCGHELEVLQSMRDAPLTVCAECGGPLQKKLYPVGVQFKGTGFYSTDYKRSKENVTDGKSESKPEKSEAKTDKAPSSASPSSSNGAKAGKSGSGEKASSKAAES